MTRYDNAQTTLAGTTTSVQSATEGTDMCFDDDSENFPRHTGHGVTDGHMTEIIV